MRSPQGEGNRLLQANNRHKEFVVIPEKSHPCWKKIVLGEKALQTSQLGLQMLLKRHAGKLTASSPAAEIQSAAAEVHEFFVKYERILSAEITSLGA